MYHRIQKLLLLGEYRHQRSTSRSDPDQQQQQQVDLEDGAEDSVRILIESPFAQVDRCGQGIRAVQLGLSATGWLFVAVDDFVANPPRGDVWWRPPCHDPEVDCLELLCALPLRFVRLKVERHRGGREVLRATLVTGRRLYFEFGGDGLLRPLLVNTWRDRIQELRCQKHGKKDKINDCEAKETIVAPDGSSSRSGDESLLGKLPEHLRLFFERERQRRRRPHDGCSSGGGGSGISSSKASTDVESCIYEWDRRHKTKEKRRLAKRMASILARNNEEEIPSPWL